MKRITRQDQFKSEIIQVEEISHLSDKEQAELIADQQAEISNSYKGIEWKDITIPPFKQEDIPHFAQSQVKGFIHRLKSKKSTPKGNIPVKIIKEFSQQISIPLSDLINSIINIYKCYKVITCKIFYSIKTLVVIQPL